MLIVGLLVEAVVSASEAGSGEPSLGGVSIIEVAVGRVSFIEVVGRFSAGGVSPSEVVMEGSPLALLCSPAPSVVV